MIDEKAIARLYFRSQSDTTVILNLPGTNYDLHLKTEGPVHPSPQGRVRGVIRLPVWKLDIISAGGAFIEPIYGRPRRVQGKVVATIADDNRVIVEVCGQPLVGQLPNRWNAADIAMGTRIGLDVREGGTFDPTDIAMDRNAPTSPAVVNLGVG